MKTFLAGVAAFALFDFVWLGFVMADFYRAQLGPIARTGPDGALTPVWAAAVPVYLLVILGVQVFVLPRGRGAASTAVWGALFGVISFGVYDLTNYATLRGFPGVIVFVDMAWGAFVCAATASAMRLAAPRSAVPN